MMTLGPALTGFFFTSSAADKSVNAHLPTITDAPVGSLLNVSDKPGLGSIMAKAVLVEFSDYECPYCKHHAAETAPKLIQEFISTGQLRLVFVNNPLSSHSNAEFLAFAAICSEEQNQFWPMHDALFNSEVNGMGDLMNIANRTNVETGALKKCVETSNRPQERLIADLEDVKKLGLTATPSFALGKLNGNGDAVLQKFIIGDQPIGTFRNLIKAMNLPGK